MNADSPRHLFNLFTLIIFEVRATQNLEDDQPHTLENVVETFLLFMIRL
jgi:hypothetical protein